MKKTTDAPKGIPRGENGGFEARKRKEADLRHWRELAEKAANRKFTDGEWAEYRKNNGVMK
jgi:hypothetical protein